MARRGNNVWLLLLMCLSSSRATGQQLVETCIMEPFKAECPVGQVVVMERAEYGRMTDSDCITAEFGKLGCENNVIDLMDSWCSGQRSCEFATMDLHKANTECSKDLMLYLLSSYTCVSVIRREFSYCTSHTNVTLREVDGFLASQITEETGCGSPRVPWIIQAKPGQIIDITMMDFGVVSNKNIHDQPCVLYGYILERSSGINHTICGSDQRQQHVYKSKSSVVEIVILPIQIRKRDNRFLLHYHKSGCPDLSPPAHSHYKRKGNTATIECDVGGRSWDLTCEENGWKGVVGNCSGQVAAVVDSDPVSKSTVLLLSGVIGLTVVVSLIILAGGICYVKKYRKKRQRKRHKRTDGNNKDNKEETPLEPHMKPSPASEVKMRAGGFRPISYGGASAAGLGYAPGFIELPNPNRSSVASYRYSSSTMYAQIVDELPHPSGQGKPVEKNTNTGPARTPGHHRQMSLQFAHNRTSSWSFGHRRQPSMPHGHSRQHSVVSNGGYDKVILAQSPGGTKVLIHQGVEHEDIVPVQNISPDEILLQHSPARGRLQSIEGARPTDPPPQPPPQHPPQLPPRGQKPNMVRAIEKEPLSTPCYPAPPSIAPAPAAPTLVPALFQNGPARSSFVETDNNGGYYSPTTGHKYYVLEQIPMLVRSDQSTN